MVIVAAFFFPDYMWTEARQVCPPVASETPPPSLPSPRLPAKSWQPHFLMSAVLLCDHTFHTVSPLSSPLSFVLEMSL